MQHLAHAAVGLVTLTSVLVHIMYIRFGFASHYEQQGAPPLAELDEITQLAIRVGWGNRGGGRSRTGEGGKEAAGGGSDSDEALFETRRQCTIPIIVLPATIGPNNGLYGDDGILMIAARARAPGGP